MKPNMTSHWLQQTYWRTLSVRSRVFRMDITLLHASKCKHRIRQSRFCLNKLTSRTSDLPKPAKFESIRGSARKSVALLKGGQQSPSTTLPQTCCSSIINGNKHIIFQQQPCDLKWHVIFSLLFFSWIAINVFFFFYLDFRKSHELNDEECAWTRDTLII